MDYMIGHQLPVPKGVNDDVYCQKLFLEDSLKTSIQQKSELSGMMYNILMTNYFKIIVAVEVHGDSMAIVIHSADLVNRTVREGCSLSSTILNFF